MLRPEPGRLRLPEPGAVQTPRASRQVQRLGEREGKGRKRLRLQGKGAAGKEGHDQLVQRAGAGEGGTP